jgi:hypothetical protein
MTGTVNRHGTQNSRFPAGSDTMPSPFPGMDPYLEAPHIWPDFHDRLAGQFSVDLNRTLPEPYYARLEMRPEVGIVGLDEPRRVVPDVAIARPRQPQPDATGENVAVLDSPRTDVSQSIHVRVPDETVRQHFVEVRDASRGHALVTLIEIASPSNKRPGADRRAYEAKQREIWGSETSLIELDLLRGGQPVVGGPPVIDSAAHLDPVPDYLVVVNRAWQRGPELDFELFPVQLEQQLPCIPVPLRQGEVEVPLDLQYALNQAYDGGPYARGAVDYGVPPEPPVRPELVDWLAGRLAPWRT